MFVATAASKRISSRGRYLLNAVLSKNHAATNNNNNTTNAATIITKAITSQEQQQHKTILLLRRCFASSSETKTATFDLTGSFETHNLETSPNLTVECTNDELLSMFELMYTMRRMEITCDNEYKSRNIRGFCHLYDGQEAVATGIHNALHPVDDSWITSYRCHCVALAKGGSVRQVVGELFGNEIGLSKGKGGSMHFYNKQNGFFGGQGIVGAQVPVGTGLAFAAKYNSTPGQPMNVAITCYGDGAVNQGQCWESANMAALWKLPIMFCIENNQYGMGTSIDRHSSISDYYKMGNYVIPGLRIDGMNVLAVREGIRYAREYCANGNGPIYIEMMTYRYHGHSMSDPGTTYRNREEIAFTRSTRDPLEFVKKCLLDAQFVLDDIEIKEIEKRLRKYVQNEVMIAKTESQPPSVLPTLVEHIFATNLYPQCKSEIPYHVRMPNYDKSYWSTGKSD